MVTLGFVGVGIFFVLLALPLRQRRVPPNRWYGLRTRATLANEAVWYEANQKNSASLMALGILVAALAVVFRVFDVDPAFQARALGAVLLVGAVASAIFGAISANRIERRLQQGKSERGR